MAALELGFGNDHGRGGLGAGTLSRARPVVLVGGWDSSRGAGLDADREALACVGQPARVVLSAITEQTEEGVLNSWVLPPGALKAQYKAALVGAGAVKIGMLGTRASVEAILECVGETEIPTVLDPVMAASSGGELLSGAGIEALRERLSAKVTLVTPNLPEFEALGGLEWARGSGTAVLLKGGHMDSEGLVDRLWLKDGSEHRFEHRRIPGVSLRGTGCRLASAIAASLANGQPLLEAVSEGIAWLQEQMSQEL
ncbi:MAG: bifunctional hydroxymethylpyrimidine kinase/phosphomethylpyrimidine kinase [Myxococcota bacterium]|nr:bifunctional hydroxymethylpyrimidine kinase/phosphomethylpyrimidine kinase [Myxococcota bacterium]